MLVQLQLLLILAAMSVRKSLSLKFVYNKAKYCRKDEFCRFFVSGSNDIDISTPKSYPIQAKDVINRLTKSLQAALVEKQSRLSIELPAAVDFGVETTKSGQSTFVFLSSTNDKIIASNRQVCKLVAEMFRVLASTTVIVFPTDTEASAAKSLWISSSFQGQVTSLETLNAKAIEAVRFKAKGSGKINRMQKDLLALESSEIPLDIPETTEVLITVGMKARDFQSLLRLDSQFGPGTVIININSRFGNGAAFQPTSKSNTAIPIGQQVESIYKNAFCYTPNPIDNNYFPRTSPSQSDIDMVLLYHEFNDKWMLAQNSAVSKQNDGEENNLFSRFTNTIKKISGQSSSSTWTTLWAGDTRPTTGDIQSILKDN